MAGLPAESLMLTSRPRVELVVDRFQPRGIDVGVDLRGGDAGVAEHLLHLPQVSPAGHEVGGETVAEGVWADIGGNTRPRRIGCCCPTAAAACGASGSGSC